MWDNCKQCGSRLGEIFGESPGACYDCGSQVCSKCSLQALPWDEVCRDGYLTKVDSPAYWSNCRRCHEKKRKRQDSINVVRSDHVGRHRTLEVGREIVTHWWRNRDYAERELRVLAAEEAGVNAIVSREYESETDSEVSDSGWGTHHFKVWRAKGRCAIVAPFDKATRPSRASFELLGRDDGAEVGPPSPLSKYVTAFLLQESERRDVSPRAVRLAILDILEAARVSGLSSGALPQSSEELMVRSEALGEAMLRAAERLDSSPKYVRAMFATLFEAVRDNGATDDDLVRLLRRLGGKR